MTAEKLAPAPGSAVSLAGNWVLDPALSDDPIEAMQAASAIADIEGRHRQSGAGKMGHGRMGGRGTGTGDRSEGAGEQTGEGSTTGGRGRNSDDLLALPDKFTVNQRAGVLELISQGRGHELYDPAAPTTEISGAGETSIKAGWDQDVFVRIRKGPGGMTRTDRFSRSVDPAGLLVETTLQAPRFHDPVRIRRLYRPA